MVTSMDAEYVLALAGGYKSYREQAPPMLPLQMRLRSEESVAESALLLTLHSPDSIVIAAVPKTCPQSRK